MTSDDKTDWRASEPIDLGAIDPFRDDRSLSGFVDRLRPHIADELVRRRQEFGLEGILLRWPRGIVAASMAVATLAAVVLIVTKDDSSSETQTVHFTFTESVGVPSEWAVWVESGTPPSATELLGLEGEMQ